VLGFLRLVSIDVDMRFTITNPASIKN
jgi:hypothetical protein